VQRLCAKIDIGKNTIRADESLDRAGVIGPCKNAAAYRTVVLVDSEGRQAPGKRNRTGANPTLPLPGNPATQESASSLLDSEALGEVQNQIVIKHYRCALFHIAVAVGNTATIGYVAPLCVQPLCLVVARV